MGNGQRVVSTYILTSGSFILKEVARSKVEEETSKLNLIRALKNP